MKIGIIGLGYVGLPLVIQFAKSTPGRVYNVALESRTSLNQLHRHLRRLTGNSKKPVHKAIRDGDVRHSLASTCAAKTDFGYCPTHALEQGLELTVQWFKTLLEGRRDSAET